MRNIIIFITILFTAFPCFAETYIKKTPSAFTYKAIYDTLYSPVGALTSESDTLESVTDRGATSNNVLEVAGIGTSGTMSGNTVSGNTVNAQILDVTDTYQSVEFFKDVTIPDASSGKSFYIYRNAAEGISYLQIIGEDWKDFTLKTIGGGLSVEAAPGYWLMLNGSGRMQIQSGADSTVTIFENSTVGENQGLQQFGWITAAGAAKYIQWQVSDATDNFELTRQDANIGSFDIQMPLITDDITASAAISATNYTSTVATGTQPYAATSTTLNTNLNADLLDGLDSTDLTPTSFGITIDGGGSVITTGLKGFREIPFDFKITGWTILADQSGSTVIDIWKDTYANFPPTVADTIAGSEKPTLTAVQKNQDLSLSTWTTDVTSGDILAFNVDSATTVTRATVIIRGTKQ